MNSSSTIRDNIITLFPDNIMSSDSDEDSGRRIAKDNSLSYDISNIEQIIKNDITATDLDWSKNAIAIDYCYETLNITKDLIKLKLFYQNSNDFSLLDKYIFEKFINFEEDDTVAINESGCPVKVIDDLLNDVHYPMRQYRFIGLKTVDKCNKMLIGMDSMINKLDEIKQFIWGNVNDITRDSMCLLLEMWLHLFDQFKWLRLRIISSFVKSTCLMINFELQVILDYLMNSTQLDDNQKFKYKARDNIINTIKSFNLFIKGLIDSLNLSIEKYDEKVFNESFQLFIDIETMYHQLNFNWLIPPDADENGTDNMNERIGQETDDEVDIHEVEELVGIGHYVDTMVNNSQDTQLDTEIDSDYESGSIVKELPQLLNAFENVKKLELELSSSFMSDSGANLWKIRSQSVSSDASSSSTLVARENNGNYILNKNQETHFKSVDNTSIPNSSSGQSNPASPMANTENNGGRSYNKLLKSPLRTSSSFPSLQFSPTASISNRKSVATNTASTLATQQLLKNDLRKLASLQHEQLGLMKNQPLARSKSFYNNGILAPKVMGFHSTVLNNLYGVNTTTNHKFHTTSR